MADMKALRKKMVEEKKAARERVKSILYPMPDLRGPRGNALVLLGYADQLMKEADTPAAFRDEFRSEAMSGDYDNVLRTIQKWFTVVVTETTHVPLGEDYDIASLKPGGGPATWEEYDSAHDGEENPDVDAAMEDFEVSAEERQRIEEIKEKVTAQVRQELGLGEDDEVVVIVKSKKG